MNDAIELSAVSVQVVSDAGVIVCDESLDGSWFLVESDIEGNHAVLKNTKPIRIINQSKEVGKTVQIVKNGSVLASGELPCEIAPGGEYEFGIGALAINWPVFV